MKHLLLTAFLFISFGGQASAYTVECKGWKPVNNEQEIYFHEKFEFPESGSVKVIFDRENTRIILDGADLPQSDVGKRAIVFEISRRENEPVGLSIFKCLIDDELTPMPTDFFELASVENFNFVTIDYETETFVRCKSF